MPQDIQLKEIHQKVIRKRTLSENLSTLYVKKQELDSKVKDLEKRKLKEQNDVDRLEKAGILSFFYSVIGKKEEKLEKERGEALEIIKQYEEALLELEGVKRSIELKKTELATLDGYEEKFHKMIQGKRRLLENTGVKAEREILKAETELSFLKEQMALLGETVKLGERILDYINKVQETLEDAERAAISQREIRKSELLSQAQKQVGKLQPVLTEFEQKVGRISEGTQIRDNLGVVYEFGNGIYTSYIAAESVLDVVSIERIRTAKGNLMLLRNQVRDIVPLLNNEKESLTQKRAVLEDRLENLIIEA